MRIGAVAAALPLALVGVATAGPANAATSAVVQCPTGDLQAAIDAAAPDSTLLVSGTCTGTFTIDKGLNLVGLGATLDAHGAGTTVTVDTTARVTLTGLTITGGSNPGSYGGGLANRGTGTVVLTASRLRNNAAAFGAGAANFGGGTLELISAQVSDNSARGQGGGLINASGGALQVTLSRVAGNSTQSGGGGVENYGTAHVAASAIESNTAQYGGGIQNNGTLTVRASTISRNRCSDSDGGGIYNLGMASLTGSTVADNTAFNGAGIYALSTPYSPEGLTVSHSTISKNTATYGDGAGLEVSSGPADLTHTQVSGNTTGGHGGGIGVAYGDVSLTDSSIMHNSAMRGGGGIYDYAGNSNYPGIVALTRTPVKANAPDNCEPAGLIAGCVG